jgi:hypothetical protein
MTGKLPKAAESKTASEPDKRKPAAFATREQTARPAHQFRQRGAASSACGQFRLR